MLLAGHLLNRLRRGTACLLLVAAVTGIGVALAQAPEDRLGVPGPLTYDGVDFHLAWSAQPTPNYFKQEYLPTGQRPESFSEMMLVEVLSSGTDVKAAIAAQVATLNQRKSSDPVANFDIIQNKETGEVILDFLLSARTAAEEIFVEWNAYRYAPYVSPDGKQGVLLVGVSRRGYGNKAKDFLTQLKSTRRDQILALSKYPLPRPQLQ